MTAPSSSSLATASTAPAPPAGPPCAGCKFLRRKCQPDCVFAPYFPPDQPHRFAHVHKVFGASNVAKVLHDLTPQQRGDAATSLAYEAEMRLRDPVYGCAGVISVLQHELRQLRTDLYRAKSELSRYYQASNVSGGGAAGAGHGLVDVNMVFPVGFGEMGTERKPFLATEAREDHHHHMLTSYEVIEMTGRQRENGACGAGFTAAEMNMEGDLGPLIDQLTKPRADSGDEREAVGPS